MSAARRVEAPVQLRLMAPPADPPTPRGETTTRTFLCGCVERGWWLTTSRPATGNRGPLRWWIHTSRRPCPRHVHGRVGGGEE